MPREKAKKPVVEPEQELIAREEEHYRLNGERRVFFNESRGCNGVAVGNGQFQAHGVPVGFEYDIESWRAMGSYGEAPIKPIVPEGLLVKLQDEISEVDEDIAFFEEEMAEHPVVHHAVHNPDEPFTVVEMEEPPKD